MPLNKEQIEKIKNEWDDYIFMDSGKDTTSEWWLKKIDEVVSALQAEHDSRVEAFIGEVEKKKRKSVANFTGYNDFTESYNLGISDVQALARKLLLDNQPPED